MKVIAKENTRYLLRFDAGEEFIAALKTFCEREDIKGATFSALGAAGEVALFWYSHSVKSYEERVIQEDLEIVNIIGNVAVKDNAIIVHAHGVFSGKDFVAVSGHMKSAVISVTCEVSLKAFSGSISRAHNPDFNLNLLD
jgi:hypothetical protein